MVASGRYSGTGGRNRTCAPMLSAQKKHLRHRSNCFAKRAAAPETQLISRAAQQDI